MKTVKIILSACVLLCGAAQMNAQQQAFSFVTTDMSARSAALAGASKSLSGGLATDALANPALLPSSGEKLGVAAGYGMWMPSHSSSNRLSAAAAYNFGRLAVSASYYGVMYSAYDVVDESGRANGRFSPSDMKLSLGVAYGFGEAWAVGANLKYLSSRLAASASYSGFAASVYGSWTREALTVSAGVEDLGPAVRTSYGSSYSLPSSVLLSAAYKFAFGEKNSIAADLDLNWFFNNGICGALGAEYSFDDMVFARAGYRLSCSAAPTASFGSVGLGFKKWGVSLDAAFLFGGALSNTLVFTLGYAF